MTKTRLFSMFGSRLFPRVNSKARMQTKQILEKIVERSRPFVVTTSDGYSVSVQSLNHLLVGNDSIVIMDSEGLFEFIPIGQVTHVSTEEGDVLSRPGSH